jgi:hypothetical protein
MDPDSDRLDARKILRRVAILGSVTSNDLYRECKLISKLKCENVFKIKNKTNPALLETSYL